MYYHGLGHWDQMAADPRLKLEDKLASAVSQKGAAAAADGKGGAEGQAAANGEGDKNLPKGGGGVCGGVRV